MRQRKPKRFNYKGTTILVAPLILAVVLILSQKFTINYVLKWYKID